MQFKKIIDGEIIQLYTIVKPNDKWNKLYPKKYVCVIYDVNNKNVSIQNVDSVPIFYLMDKYCYIFSKQPSQQLKKTFGFMKDIHINDNNNIIKKCGFNSVNPELLTKDYNSVMCVLSLKNQEYPPTYLTQDIYIQSNYNEMITINDYQKVVNKIVNKHNKQFKINDFVDFIKQLQINFPLNYGGSIRRFHDTITKESFKNVINKQKQQYEYYLGYDCRDITDDNEIELAKHMEQSVYLSNNDYTYVYETYNNSMSKIKQICKDNNINYKQIHKHCISVNNDDYNKLSTKLTATLSDFIC